MRAPSPLLIAGLGVLFGTLVDALIKGAANDLPVLTITLWRFIFGALYALAIYLASGRPMPSWPAIRFHALRGCVTIVSAFSFFWALTQLALAEATVLGFTAALMIAPIARVVLGERITGVSVAAAVIGFAGAAFAISGETTGAPEDGNRLLGAASVMAAAFTYALGIVLIRLRTRQEDSLTIVMFTNVMPCLLLVAGFLAAEAAGFGAGLQSLPRLDQTPILALIGLFGLGIWWMFTLAYARAPAQRLAPIEYTALIWSSLIGYLIFRETPDWRLFVGAAVIIAACLIVAFQDRFANRRSARLPASDLLE